MILITFKARRLVWLHAFARNERWKEELLLTREELRRLGAWYSHEIKRTHALTIEIAKNVTLTKGQDGNRFLRGHIALMWEKYFQLCALREGLPKMAKEGGVSLNPEGLHLGPNHDS